MTLARRPQPSFGSMPGQCLELSTNFTAAKSGLITYPSLPLRRLLLPSPTAQPPHPVGNEGSPRCRVEQLQGRVVLAVEPAQPFASSTAVFHFPARRRKARCAEVEATRSPSIPSKSTVTPSLWAALYRTCGRIMLVKEQVSASDRA